MSRSAPADEDVPCHHAGVNDGRPAQVMRAMVAMFASGDRPGTPTGVRASKGP